MPTEANPIFSFLDKRDGSSGNLFIPEELGARILGYEELNEMRLAEAILMTYKHRLSFIDGIGWFEFEDNEGWRPVSEDVLALYVRAAIEALYRISECQSFSKQDRDKWLKLYIKFSAGRVQSGIKSLVKAYSKDPAFGIVSSATDWDANPSLIGTPTGILDLDTGLLNEFAPEFRIRYRTRGCVLEPEVEHQVIWAEFLEEVLPDPEVRAYVRWAMSRAVFGATKDEVLYILFGPSRTGKSTFLNAFLNALGNYACSMSASLFSEDLSDDRPRPELMRLINKRFVAAAEAEHDAKFSLPTVKRLTGGDPLTARGLYEAIVEFRTKHSLFLATNAVPEAAIDDAMRYRMRIIPFETVISASREDRERKEWLSHSDEAASAVLQWLRLGAKEHCGHPDWPVPEAVRKYTTSSVADMDPFQEFLSDCIEEAEDSFVTATDLYDTYEKWCGKDETPLSRKAVSKRLKGLKFKMVRKNLLGGKQRVWLGARLSEQSE